MRIGFAQKKKKLWGRWAEDCFFFAIHTWVKFSLILAQQQLFGHQRHEVEGGGRKAGQRWCQKGIEKEREENIMKGGCKESKRKTDD